MTAGMRRSLGSGERADATATQTGVITCNEGNNKNIKDGDKDTAQQCYRHDLAAILGGVSPEMMALALQGPRP